MSHSVSQKHYNCEYEGLWQRKPGLRLSLSVQCAKFGTIPDRQHQHRGHEFTSWSIFPMHIVWRYFVTTT